jgi:hypothetical protein
LHCYYLFFFSHEGMEQRETAPLLGTHLSRPPLLPYFGVAVREECIIATAAAAATCVAAAASPTSASTGRSFNIVAAAPAAVTAARRCRQEAAARRRRRPSRNSHGVIHGDFLQSKPGKKINSFFLNWGFSIGK